ncbi:hypothetical protein O0L34_g14567 [Tuta absoluta]|nr:hypothetical protein O0L34_g14567 [Tuta absoluta]
MESLVAMWAMIEHVRVASGAAELAIFTALLYWFFTSSRVADMLEVVGERVTGWCGRDTSGSLRQCVRARRRHHADVYSKLDAERTVGPTYLQPHKCPILLCSTVTSVCPSEAPTQRRRVLQT